MSSDENSAVTGMQIDQTYPEAENMGNIPNLYIILKLDSPLFCLKNLINTEEAKSGKLWGSQYFEKAPK